MAPNQQIPESIFPQTPQDPVQISKKEVLYDGVLYDVSNFIHRHPGGDKILGNYTAPGEDATLAIQQFHSRSIDKVLKMMKSLPHRPQPLYELSDEMKKVRERNEKMTADFVQLYKELKNEGMFEPWFPHWIYRFVEIFALRLLGYSLITDTTGGWTQFLGILILVQSIARGLWMQHEFGHISATGNTKVDRIIQSVLCGCSAGWSGYWWRRHHNKHHAMTNRVENDPDVPLFPGVVESRDNPMKYTKPPLTVTYTHRPFFSVVLVPYTVALYLQWVYWKSITSVVRNKSVVELISVMSFHYMMYTIGFWPWISTMALYAYYFFTNAALSHSATPVAIGPMHWIEATFLGTVDIEHRPWCDWWMGYLNYQIEHHLFPTMPQFRGPMVKERVKALAEKYGLPYHMYSYKDALIHLVKNAKNVPDFIQNID